MAGLHRVLGRWKAVLRTLAPALALAPAAAEAATSPASELRIRVDGVNSATGMVQYAVFDSPRHFPGRSPRTTMVAVFHDANGNDEFDRGIFGIPLETYGFSNNASGFFSAPAFADAAFALHGPRTEISITLGR